MSLLGVAGLVLLFLLAWKSWRIGLEYWYIAQLDSADVKARERAAAELAAMRSARAVPRLIEILARLPMEEEVTEPVTRQDPFSGALEAAGISALPHLERKLRSELPAERFRAADWIGRLGPDAASAADSLFSLLSDGDLLVRIQAALAIGSVGRRSPSVVRSLAEALQSRANSTELRKLCLEGLVNLAEIPRRYYYALISGERDPGAIMSPSVEQLEAQDNVSAVLAILAPVIQEDEGEVRKAAVHAFLGLLRWPASDVAPPGWSASFDPGPVLASLAADQDPAFRVQAVRFFAKAAPGERSLAVLVRALRDPELELRTEAAEALRRHGEAASAAGPALLEVLGDEDPSIRKLAALSIVFTRGVPLESLEEKAVPVLAACLSDEDPFVWWRAAEALGALGPTARGAVPALVRALRDRNGLVNPWALAALEAIGPEAAAAVPAVLSILAEDDSKTFADALRALKVIGQLPDLTIPALRRLLAEAGPADADLLEKLRAAGAAKERINDSIESTNGASPPAVD